MGDAKKRKGFDPNFGKKKEIEVTFDDNVSLPESLEKAKTKLTEDDISHQPGILRINDVDYPVLFLPKWEKQGKKTKIFCQFMIAPECKPPKMNQKLINEISQLASQKIKETFDVLLINS
ncbi:MAG: hypothetical protein QNJ54_31690 [Prochloraceae cyanobacterium]|nr:hypothetical protein [Prochloraceae cyanobacterium]